MTLKRRTIIEFNAVSIIDFSSSGVRECTQVMIQCFCEKRNVRVYSKCAGGENGFRQPGEMLNVVASNSVGVTVCLGRSSTGS